MILCQFLCELNKITVHDQFLLPYTDDLVDTLANSKVYSGLNLRSGYWQLHIAEESIKCTEFIMQLGQWEWLFFLMGLSNALSTF